MRICCCLMVILDDEGLDQKRVRECIELHSSCLHVLNNLRGQPSDGEPSSGLFTEG